jgi:hypothetical protein
LQWPADSTYKSAAHESDTGCLHGHEAMSEKPEEDFEDGDTNDSVDGGEELDIDGMMRDFDTHKRRGRGNGGHHADPAWRKLERFLDDQRTAELLTDFDDYDIRADGEDDEPAPPRSKPGPGPGPRRRT